MLKKTCPWRWIEGVMLGGQKRERAKIAVSHRGKHVRSALNRLNAESKMLYNDP